MTEIALLARLRDAGGARFDAAGWHYIESLARRSATHEGSARRMLDAKLALALEAFAARFAQARTAANAVLASACEQYPHQAPELQRLHAEADFNGLRRLRATLDGRVQSAALGALVAQLAPTVSATPAPPNVRHAVTRPIETPSATLELKTVRESRDTWARLSVDKQLALAMKQAPQNAGPINSHMLVLRSLAKMQAISPDYLNRLVSYVDTLLSLDPGEVIVPAKKKKAVAAKSGKPAKAVRK